MASTIFGIVMSSAGGLLTSFIPWRQMQLNLRPNSLKKARFSISS